MCEWMDGWFRVGLCSACEGKCSAVKEDEGMEWMGWDGMVRQGECEWYGAVRAAVTVVRQGKAGGGRYGGWWVVWAEFELGCAGQKEVGGQAAGAGELGAGGSWGGQEASRGEGDQTANVAGGAHTRTRQRQRQTLVARSFVHPWLQGLLPRH